MKLHGFFNIQVSRGRYYLVGCFLKSYFKVLKANNVPGGLCSLITGDGNVGQSLVKDKRVNLVSFTGSTAVGKIVGQQVQARFGKVAHSCWMHEGVAICHRKYNKKSSIMIPDWSISMKLLKRRHIL